MPYAQPLFVLAPKSAKTAVFCLKTYRWIHHNLLHFSNVSIQKKEPPNAKKRIKNTNADLFKDKD